MKITVIGALMIVAGAVLLVIVMDQVSRKLGASPKNRSERNNADSNDQPNNPDN
jgi:hypothetical protein